METKKSKYVVDVLILLLAGSVVAVAFFFFQNSNGFAPGGVGGIATGVISGVGFSLMLKRFGGQDDGVRNVPLECYEIVSAKTKAEQEHIHLILLEIDKYKNSGVTR